MSGRGDGGGPTIRDGLATTISADMVGDRGCQYLILSPIRQRPTTTEPYQKPSGGGPDS